MIEEKQMSYIEWQNIMGYRYDFMPDWWWHESQRQEAYNNYLETNVPDIGV